MGRAFTLVPNWVDSLDLTPYAFRLYIHLLRTAQREGGVSYETTRELADACSMSTGTVSKAKRELKDKGLIRLFWWQDEAGRHRHGMAVPGTEPWRTGEPWKPERGDEP